MLNKNAKHRCLLLSTCAVAAIIAGGCRNMSGRNMFAWRGEPSAETLAGNGPTATYPPPPSASATPEAIASVAGGTAVAASAPVTAPASRPTTAQVAGIDVSPGYVTPTSSIGSPNSTTTNNSSPNMAAAEANGIYGTPRSGGPITPPAKRSGYTFGTNTQPPKAGIAANSSAPLKAPSTSSYTNNSSFAPPPGSFAPPPGSFATPSTSLTPPAASSYTTPPPAGVSASRSSGGFTLPTDSPAVAAITPPKPPEIKAKTTASTSFALPEAALPEAALPEAASSADFSTASTSDALSAPSTTSGASASTSSSATSSDSGGYMPGSTSSSGGYPSGDASPTTRGSYYR